MASAREPNPVGAEPSESAQRAAHRRLLRLTVVTSAVAAAFAVPAALWIERDVPADSRPSLAKAVALLPIAFAVLPAFIAAFPWIEKWEAWLDRKLGIPPHSRSTRRGRPVE